jgi:hypothetical protein
MRTRSASPRPAELADEASNWVVGGGMITLALFPLALPALVLLAIGLIPFLIPALAAGVLLAGLALPFLLIRGVLRRVLRARRPRRAAVPRPQASRLSRAG